jgi:predicted SAM-dependent methyltransferase
MANSETSKARERLKKYCTGNGIDLGYGGDPIVPTAITLDRNEGPYTVFSNYPQNLFGDARNLYWFRDCVFDYVYSSHLLEDFAEEETPVILKEWLRVVKKGGFLVIYCPDEQVYRKRCETTGQSYNTSHKIDNFGLNYLKTVLDKFFSGEYEIIHQVELIDDYCFDLVIRKLK